MPEHTEQLSVQFERLGNNVSLGGVSFGIRLVIQSGVLGQLMFYKHACYGKFNLK